MTADRGLVIHDILQERRHAEEKFPGQHLPLGFGADADRWVADRARQMTDRAADEGRLTWRHVIGEEFWEAVGEPDPVKARAGLVQLASMCVRAIEDIDDPQPADYTGPSGVHWRQAGSALARVEVAP